LFGYRGNSSFPPFLRMLFPLSWKFLFPSFSTDLNYHVVEILVSLLFYGSELPCRGNSCFPPFLRMSLLAPPVILGFSMASIIEVFSRLVSFLFYGAKPLLSHTRTFQCLLCLRRLAAFGRSPFPPSNLPTYSHISMPSSL
jgi:hypothetical protein